MSMRQLFAVRGVPVHGSNAVPMARCIPNIPRPPLWQTVSDLPTFISLPSPIIRILKAILRNSLTASSSEPKCRFTRLPFPAICMWELSTISLHAGALPPRHSTSPVGKCSTRLLSVPEIFPSSLSSYPLRCKGTAKTVRHDCPAAQITLRKRSI